MLEPKAHAHLIKALYGVLMILPQVHASGPGSNARSNVSPTPVARATALHALGDERRLTSFRFFAAFQTEAYHTLRCRLETVPGIIHSLDGLEPDTLPPAKVNHPDIEQAINFPVRSLCRHGRSFFGRHATLTRSSSAASTFDSFCSPRTAPQALLAHFDMVQAATQTAVASAQQVAASSD